MDDLVERLRAYKPYKLPNTGWFGPPMCEEAADEIEALRAHLRTMIGVASQLGAANYVHTAKQIKEARQALQERNNA